MKTIKLYVYLDRWVVETNKLGQLRSNHSAEISNLSSYQPTLLAVSCMFLCPRFLHSCQAGAFPLVTCPAVTLEREDGALHHSQSEELRNELASVESSKRGKLAGVIRPLMCVL